MNNDFNFSRSGMIIRAMGLLVLLVLVFAPASAQNKPVRIKEYQADKALKLKSLPSLGESFAYRDYCDEATGRETGYVKTIFSKGKLGKAKFSKCEIMTRSTITTSLLLEVDSKAKVKKMLRQLEKQFGTPYKIEGADGKYRYSWKGNMEGMPDNASIQVEVGEDWTSGSTYLWME